MSLFTLEPRSYLRYIPMTNPLGREARRWGGLSSSLYKSPPFDPHWGGVTTDCEAPLLCMGIGRGGETGMGYCWFPADCPLLHTLDFHWFCLPISVLVVAGPPPLPPPRRGGLFRGPRGGGHGRAGHISSRYLTINRVPWSLGVSSI